MTPEPYCGKQVNGFSVRSIVRMALPSPGALVAGLHPQHLFPPVRQQGRRGSQRNRRGIELGRVLINGSWVSDWADVGFRANTSRKPADVGNSACSHEWALGLTLGATTTTRPGFVRD